MESGFNGPYNGHLEKTDDMKYTFFYRGDSGSEEAGALSSISNPFSTQSWLFILGSILLSFIVHHVVLKGNLGTLFWSGWTVLSPFLCQIPDQKTRNGIIFFWIFSSFLLTNFYLAELTSTEISPRVVKSNKEFKDLRLEGFKFAFPTPRTQDQITHHAYRLIKSEKYLLT